MLPVILRYLATFGVGNKCFVTFYSKAHVTPKLEKNRKIVLFWCLSRYIEVFCGIHSNIGPFTEVYLDCLIHLLIDLAAKIN